MVNDIDEQIAEDRKFIQETSAQNFLRERVIGGASRVLEPDQQASLKETISERFGLHPNRVIIVGSAKLGYSVSPSKALRPFSDKSDVDVALICPNLFERYWLEMYQAKRSMLDWENLGDARKYLFRGWIRPDMLPLLEIRNEWFDFFSSLQSAEVGSPFPVRAGLYFNDTFLEYYQEIGIIKSFEAVC